MGKIIGGGMPVGAYGGKKEIMDCVSPAGPVYQAGTLSGNPIAMAAGQAMLTYLNEHPEVYERIETVGNTLTSGIRANMQKLGLNYTLNHVGSMFTLFFTDKPVNNFEDAKSSDTALFGKFFNAMLKRGIYMAPSQYEAMFISTALTDEHVAQILDASYESFQEILA
jgi:glutamate-1-semialdehyde 2,1-aminomutase